MIQVALVLINGLVLLGRGAAAGTETAALPADECPPSPVEEAICIILETAENIYDDAVEGCRRLTANCPL